jgi:hypothetical protein
LFQSRFVIIRKLRRFGFHGGINLSSIGLNGG